MVKNLSGDEMPVIEVDKKDMIELTGIPEEELREVLTLVKAPIDEEEGDKWILEITADRPDLLSPEGVARAVKGYIGKETGLPSYKIIDTNIEVKVNEVKSRPYIAAGAVYNVKLNDYLIKSIMQIQEKIHETLGRRRKKVAIGVHDLDKVVPPFEYKEVEPEEIAFVPLGKNVEMNLNDILKEHEKGKEYAYTLEGYEKYPIIVDKLGEVLSFPPIINGELTKVTESTKNLFIEVTGTDKEIVEKTLNIILSSIAERGGEIGRVKVGDRTYPEFTPEQITINIEDVDRLLGIGLREHEIAEILERMRYSVIELKGGRITVFVPAYRTDILHDVDIIEDIAIGYGYNNLGTEIPKVHTNGRYLPLEKKKRKVREILIGLGFQEILSFMLTNKEKLYEKMNVKDKGGIEILNPMSNEYNMVRTWLLPSIMEFLSENTHRKYPQKVFEIGEVVLPDEKSETRSKTKTLLSGAIAHDKTNLTEMKSVVEAIGRELNTSIIIKEGNHPSFIETRVGEIYLNGKKCGYFGEIYPSVLEKWKIEKPVIAFEIDLTELLQT